MTITASPEYKIVAEQYLPHIKAATVQQFANLNGGKYPTSAQADHVVEQVMATIKLEIERAYDMKQKPNLAVGKILEQIKATIRAEFPQKAVTP